MPSRVGRQHELTRLIQLVNTRAPVLVLGLPGSGKRTLVGALRAQRPDVLRLSPEEALAGEGRGVPALAIATRWVERWPGAVLRLGGLDRHDALALWRALDLERGAMPGFAAAYRRSGGHPGALLAAHDGQPADRELASVVAALSAEERGVALVLALHGGAAPAELWPPEVISSLVSTLALEPIGVGWLRLAPELASLLVGTAGETALAAARGALPRLWRELDARLGDPRAAARELGAPLAEACIARVPHDRRSPAMRAARARLLVELCDSRRALAIAEDLPADDPSAARLRAELALRCGRLDDAERILTGVPDPALEAILALQRGEGLGAGASPHGRAWAAWWTCDDDALADATRDAERDEQPEMWLLGGIAAARHGQLDDARRLLRQLQEPSVSDERPRCALLARLLVAAIERAEGHRRRARAELETVAARLELAGETPFALAVRLESATLLHLLGRRRQATAELVEIERRARQLGLAGLVRALEHAAAAELTRWVWRARQPVPQAPPGVAYRQHAVAAVQAAFSGHDVIAEVALSAMDDMPRDDDFAVERMLVALARSALARVRGAHDESLRQIAEATRQAGSGGVDATIVAALVSVLGRERVVTSTGRRLAMASRSALNERAVVIDATRHEVRAEKGRLVIRLDRRPVLARLLYALAAHPDGELDKDALTLSLWDVPYNPLVHDNALKANVHRLNRMIHAAKLSVTFGDRGYQLHGPPEMTYVECPSIRRPNLTGSNHLELVATVAPEH